MIDFVKILWGVRAFLYKAIFKEIGMPSYLGKTLYIKYPRNISIGKRCRIYPGLRAEIVDKNGKIIIGDNVSIGQNFHVVSFRDKLEIKNDVTISGNVFISNCDHCYEKIGIHVLEQELIYKETLIEEECFIGYGVVIQAGTKLGKHCIVGANSVVRGEFPDYCVIVGSPARIIKKYNFKDNKWEKVIESGH